MFINGTEILDTYAEAFPTWLSRVIITADSLKWAKIAAAEATGFASSTIGCPCEAGIEQILSPDETPDGREGIAILICTAKKTIRQETTARIGQSILPVPTTSAFNGFPDARDRFYTRMHYFGDGHEEKVEHAGRNCWKIPVMEGTYVGEERFGTVKGIAGGNIVIMAPTQKAALLGAEAAAAAVERAPGVTSSFPGGIIRSGSKVGCKYYRFPMPASTNDQLCPTLRTTTSDSAIPEGVTCTYEIVINGITEVSVIKAMKDSIIAACDVDGVTHIGASNFSGKLGPYQYRLQDLFK